MNNLPVSEISLVDYEVDKSVMIDEDRKPQFLHLPPRNLDQCEVVFLGPTAEGLDRKESVPVSNSDPRPYVSDIQTIYIDGVDHIQRQKNVEYVNARQYHRILVRRQERQRLILQRRIPEFRSKYLHESRHKLALERPRNSAGKFVKRVKDENVKEVIQLVAEHQGGMNVKTEMDEDDKSEPDVILPSFNRGGLKQKKDSYKEEYICR